MDGRMTPQCVIIRFERDSSIRFSSISDTERCNRSAYLSAGEDSQMRKLSTVLVIILPILRSNQSWSFTFACVYHILASLLSAISITTNVAMGLLLTLGTAAASHQRYLVVDAHANTDFSQSMSLSKHVMFWYDLWRWRSQISSRCHQSGCISRSTTNTKGVAIEYPVVLLGQLLSFRFSPEEQNEKMEIRSKWQPGGKIKLHSFYTNI